MVKIEKKKSLGFDDDDEKKMGLKYKYQKGMWR